MSCRTRPVQHGLGLGRCLQDLGKPGYCPELQLNDDRPSTPSPAVFNSSSKVWYVNYVSSPTGLFYSHPLPSTPMSCYQPPVNPRCQSVHVPPFCISHPSMTVSPVRQSLPRETVSLSLEDISGPKTFLTGFLLPFCSSMQLSPV